MWERKTPVPVLALAMVQVHTMKIKGFVTGGSVLNTASKSLYVYLYLWISFYLQFFLVVVCSEDGSDGNSGDNSCKIIIKVK